MFRRLINHHRAIIVMYDLTESPLSSHDRFPGEIGDCFFTVNKIKTNPLPLATKDLVSKTRNPVALIPREMKALLQIKKLRKISKFLPFLRYHSTLIPLILFKS